MNIESGSMITGKWLNTMNGMIITVVDTVIDENNQMVIVTDKGTIEMNEFSTNFVQCDDETLNIFNNTSKAAASSKQNVTTLKNLRDEFDLFDEEPVKDKKSTVSIDTKCESNDNQSVIDKLFKKIHSKPEIIIDIKWDDFPKEQIDMLINFLDVEKSEITKYLIKNYFDSKTLEEAIEKMIG